MITLDHWTILPPCIINIIQKQQQFLDPQLVMEYLGDLRSTQEVHLLYSTVHRNKYYPDLLDGHEILQHIIYM